MNAAATPKFARARVNSQMGAGISSCIEASVTFFVWAATRKTPPNHTDVMERFGCSRATAYRHINAFRNLQSKGFLHEIQRAARASDAG